MSSLGGVEGNAGGCGFEGGSDLRKDRIPEGAALRGTVFPVHEGVRSLDSSMSFEVYLRT